MKSAAKKHPLIAGTLILTAANIISRVMGFFYRIYLSRTFGAEAMGILGLTGPVSSMVFALSGAGMHTAISKCVSSVSEQDKKRRHWYLFCGLAFALAISVFCSGIVYLYADSIAVNVLSERRTAPLLKILALSFPMNVAHACINGYFIGRHKTGITALSQCIEQAVRIATVFICCNSFLSTGDAPSLTFTAWGLFMGEAVALFVSLLGLFLSRHKSIHTHTLIPHPGNQSRSCMHTLLKLAVPVSLNRLSVNFLSSIEAVRIPMMLEISGMTPEGALSVYGILTGMVMPVLHFPGAFTGSLAVMLLPSVSEAYSRGDKNKIKTLSINATFFVVMIGLFFGILFYMFSDMLGTLVFKEPLAASYIRALCLLCPFMYVNGIFTGILQGVGKVMDILFIQITGLFVRLIFVFFCIPRMGISGYFAGLLVSQIYSCALYLYKCYRLN